MKMNYILAAFLLISSVNLPVQAEDAPPAVTRLAPSLESWGSNPTLVAAVKEQNAKGMSLDDIKMRDTEWMDFSGISDFMSSLMNNAAAQELKQLEASAPYFTEVFLMDNQGANVAMTNKTSDYWQGDESKFSESFNNGSGAVHVGEVEFDESAQAYLVQVSVPVKDEASTIGAITIGVNLDELEAAGN